MIEICLFFIGLCFGSFVNMLVYRTAVLYKLPIFNFKFSKTIKDKKKILDRVQNDGITGRSFCDGCGKQLAWYENIPVLSWLLEKGKTRCCGRKLDWSYPLVELITALLLILNFKFLILKQENIYFSLVVASVITIFMVFSFVFDAKYMILPDFATLFLSILAVAWYFMSGTRHGAFLQDNVLAAVVGFGFIGFLWWITKGRGMGFGDVKLAGFMGLLLGLKGLLIAMYFAFGVGAVYGIFMMILKKKTRKSQIPFGPFLLSGTLFSLWFSGNIKLW